VRFIQIIVAAPRESAERFLQIVVRIFTNAATAQKANLDSGLNRGEIQRHFGGEAGLQHPETKADVWCFILRAAFRTDD
jgi:hypothetical protein